MSSSPRLLSASVLLLACGQWQCSGGDAVTSGSDPNAPTGVVVPPDATDPADPNAPPGTEPGTSPSTPDPGVTPPTGVGIGDITSVDPATLTDGVTATSLLPRLTYAEYDQSVSDLLYLPVQPSVDFPEEPPNLEGYLSPGQLIINDRLRAELSRTATVLANQAVTTPEAYAQLVTCDTANSDCATQFIAEFGRRAYRRPLTAPEAQTLATLFAAGPQAIGSGDAFADGVELVIEAILQSPKFLYRVEQGEGQDALGIPLTDYEIATRLSYLLIGTTPDAALLDAADRGELATTEQIATQAARLLQDTRLLGRVVDFHDRWLQADGLLGVAKDADLFPEFSAEVVDAMMQETRAFVEQVTLDDDGGILELLTAPYTVVDSQLADIYGLNGIGNGGAQRVDFAADSPRAGLLTQPAFLSAHSSSSVTTSPILRGIFTLRRIMCFEGIPDPPPNAQAQVPTAPRPPDPATTRDLTSWTTSLTLCGTCHSIINPIGFAFEEFDAIGRFRATENGVPIDATGSVAVPASLNFNGTKDFAAQIAALPDTRACYARNWFRFANGRLESEGDLRTLALIAQGLGAPSFGARDTLAVLTQSAAFTHIAE